MKTTTGTWKRLYLIGGMTMLLVIAGTLLDIVIGSVTGVDLTMLPDTSVERFVEFRQSPIMGLYHLDFLNMILYFLMVPTFLSIFALHRKVNTCMAGLALLFACIGITIIISGNAALPMLDLSRQYFLSVSEIQKSYIAGAGEALLVKGGHGSPGAFPGMFFLNLGSLIFSLVMITGQVFKKAVGILGLSGNILLLFYIVLIAFFPKTHSAALAIAAPGGLAILAWYIMIAVKLLMVSGMEE